MLDIFILERDKDSFVLLKDLCVGYLIRKNYDADIYMYPSENPPETAAIYMFIFDGRIEKLSKTVRDLNSGSYVIAIIENTADLTRAVTPAIMPSGIVIKPCKKENVDMILDEVYEDYFRSSSDRCGELFTFRLKAKEYSIPFERILYFESRNKKMIIRTETQELEFYGTLDSVMSAAPQCFMRIHKSFIANIDRISVVDYGKMTVEFDDGSAVLLSRTFKAQLKERLNAKGEL